MSDDFSVLDPGVLAKAPELAQRLLNLNNDHAAELSWLEPDRMADLIGQAFVAMSIDDGCALLITFDQDADYDSPNYLWFRDRFDRFIYVDRVVISPLARGRGHARRLYEALFARARAAGHDQVVCEINADPPNPVSDAFHDSLGFVEVGAGLIHGGTKSVRYFARRLG
jgi:predicted GNAT superfamily acetyltransferase